MQHIILRECWKGIKHADGTRSAFMGKLLNGEHMFE